MWVENDSHIQFSKYTKRPILNVERAIKGKLRNIKL